MAEIRRDEKGRPIGDRHYVTDFEDFPRVWNKIVNYDMPIDVNTFRKWVALEIYRRIIIRSPVDRGFYRASHNISVGASDISMPTEPSTSRGGAKATGSEEQKFFNGLAALADIDVKSAIWLTTNLPYSEVIENGGYPTPVKKGSYIRKGRPGAPGHFILSAGGFSRQAPAGVYRISAHEVIARIESSGAAT